MDELVEGVLLEALAPDRIAIALAALGELEEESRQLERQWTLQRERVRYEAEPARRQYDAVHARSRPGEPISISDTDRAGLQSLGEILPRIWHASTTSAAERKRIFRFIVREVCSTKKEPYSLIEMGIHTLGRPITPSLGQP